ncbi:MAG: type II secretion system secretin GspD [Xanthomonadales bacterium]|nr:type II secretion system secretin GspD [Xanthomonadales bacterium]
MMFVVAALVGLTGCATTRPGQLSPLGSPVSVLADRAGEDAEPPSAEVLGDDKSAVEMPTFPIKDEGTGSFINEKAASRIPPAPTGSGEVTFNFEGESLHAVIKTILGEILQQNYVVAPGVQGTVTFATAKPLRSDQALSILEMLLRWNNATLVWQDGRYTILPVAQAVPGNLTPRTGPVSNARGFELRAVPLQYISVMEMEKLLKPYAKPDAIVNVDPARNMLVLGGTRSELENYLQTVDIFDVDWLSGMSVGMFSLQQAEADKVVSELEKIFGEGSSTPLAGMFRFVPLEGINGVMVITPQKEYLKSVEEWLERLDLGSGEAGARLYVYDVKNVNAADLAQTLGDVFGGSSGGGGGRSGGSVAPGLQPARLNSVTNQRSGGTRSQSNQKSASTSSSNEKQAAVNNNQRGTNTRSSNTRGGAAARGTNSQGSSGGSGGGNVSLTLDDDVRLSSVEESNSLIVRATPMQWESIRRVIERLDIVPLQVVIEAQIISVQLNDQLSYGVRWYFENAVAGGLGDGAPSAVGRNIWGDFAGSIQGAATSWSFVGPNAGAIIDLIDDVSEVRVLSAPSLVVLNNKSATINSGSSIPINSTSIGGIGGVSGDTVFNTTQYLQTGITLSVTPRVNPGGLVFLQIDQEDSSPVGEIQPGTNPPISQNTISTEIAIQSGQSVVLGGLIKQTDTKGNSGVPGLSRLPVVGGLFGRKSRSVNRQELLVLITPKVVHNTDEARRITEEYKAQFRAIEPFRRK